MGVEKYALIRKTKTLLRECRNSLEEAGEFNPRRVEWQDAVSTLETYLGVVSACDRQAEIERWGEVIHSMREDLYGGEYETNKFEAEGDEGEERQAYVLDSMSQEDLLFQASGLAELSDSHRKVVDSLLKNLLIFLAEPKVAEVRSRRIEAALLGFYPSVSSFGSSAELGKSWGQTRAAPSKILSELALALGGLELPKQKPARYKEQCKQNAKAYHLKRKS